MDQDRQEQSAKTAAKIMDEQKRRHAKVVTISAIIVGAALLGTLILIGSQVL